MLDRLPFRLALAALAGVALWAAFPNENLWWAAPFAVALFAPATAGIHGRRGRRGALIGFVFGMAFFLPTLSWSGVYVGAVPWVALAVLQSLYFAALGGVLGLLQHSRIRPGIFACAWMTQEWLRGTTPFGGFPWVRLAFSQADAPWAPIIAWVTASGLSFLIALIGAVIAAWAMAFMPRALRRRAEKTTPGVRSWLSVATAAALAGLVIGCLISPPTSGKHLRVAAVQGNVPTAGLDFNAQRRAVLDNHAKATMALAQQIDAHRQPRPDVVVWPENSSDIDPKRNGDAATEINTALNAVNTPLIVGAVLDEPSPKVSNAAMLYLPHRGLSAEYVKQHPVPFGEYIPYRSFFRKFSDKVDLVRADFVQGKKVGLFTLPTRQGQVKAAPIICFEVAYDDLVRKPMNRNAQILLVQTNNATFGYTAESTQQLAISRLRALEYGRSVVHVSTVGVSALITPDGRMHDASRLFTQKTLIGELPLRSQATLAQHLGRVPEIAGALALVITLALLRRRPTKSSEAVER